MYYVANVQLYLLLLILAPTVNFDQSTYGIDEDKGSVQLLLELSNPSTTDITIRVFSSDGSATGKFCCCNYSCIYWGLACKLTDF